MRSIRYPRGAVKLVPKHYKVELENDPVRVIRLHRSERLIGGRQPAVRHGRPLADGPCRGHPLRMSAETTSVKGGDMD